MNQSVAPLPSASNPRAAPGGNLVELRLYVAGQSPKSLAAVANLKRICEENHVGRYAIEVVDLVLNPASARADQIVVIPTLVRCRPEPTRRVIGDLSNVDRVLSGLDLCAAARK